MKNICVFCGAGKGAAPVYAEAAAALGQAIAEAGYTLVYGGACVGLMGILADSALNAGAEVIGILPRFIANVEVAHRGLSRLHLVDGMMSRKQMMIELSDAFITLPGGLGTLDELFEVWSWRYLGLHDKPLGMLNVANFYDGLQQFIASAAIAGFIKPSIINEMHIRDDPRALLDCLSDSRPALHSIQDKLHGSAIK